MTRSARVLHVLDSLGAGGIETTFLHLLRACRDPAPGSPTRIGSAWDRKPGGLTHEVMALSDGPLEPAFREAADEVFICRRPAEIDRVLERDPVVVHALHDRAAHRVLPRVVARGRAATIYGKGYDLSATYRMEGAYDSAADRALLNACDAVTFTTAALASEYRVPADRVTVLGKAVALDRFAQLPDPDPLVGDCLIAVANLHPGKRLIDLLRALPAVRRAVPTALLTVVGGDRGGEAGRLGSAAVSLGIRDIVEFTGVCLDVPAWLGDSRIAVLPSLREGVPTVLLEAMAAGRPVVATRVGHVDTIVEDGVEGYLVAAGDVAALADRIVRLLTDRRLAARMGAAGRRRAAAHDVRAVARVWLDLLSRTARLQREIEAA